MNVVKLAPGDARVLGGVITLRLRWRKVGGWGSRKEGWGGVRVGMGQVEGFMG